MINIDLREICMTVLGLNGIEKMERLFVGKKPDMCVEEKLSIELSAMFTSVCLGAAGVYAALAL